ncbi:MAG: ribonuclease P protein component [candidate division WOR-3 bacterium]|uniref:Ribonuclease P protein component n=2 Tax=candidate division WOR-3 bacterium TaxID=2052148 RepID=A0A7C1SKJ6_UNCW3|nr:ribonuclease P protein component [candidate division WOR-3 bacterium]
MRESLKRVEIVRHRRAVISIAQQGKRIVSPLFTLKYLKTETHNPARRIAFHLSSKIHGAVIRNLLKRRLREIYRRNKEWLPAGYDYIVQVRPGAENLSYEALKQEIRKLFWGVSACSQDSSCS